MKLYKFIFVYIAVLATTTHGWDIPFKIMYGTKVYEVKESSIKPCLETYVYKYECGQDKCDKLTLDITRHKTAVLCMDFVIRHDTRVINRPVNSSYYRGTVIANDKGIPTLLLGSFSLSDNSGIPQWRLPGLQSNLLRSLGIDVSANVQSTPQSVQVRDKDFSLI